MILKPSLRRELRRWSLTLALTWLSGYHSKAAKPCCCRTSAGEDAAAAGCAPTTSRTDAQASRLVIVALCLITPPAPSWPIQVSSAARPAVEGSALPVPMDLAALPIRDAEPKSLAHLHGCRHGRGRHVLCFPSRGCGAACTTTPSHRSPTGSASPATPFWRRAC